MAGMPDIDFPVTIANPEGQKFFNQGVGQLHGFWYFEAERSFRQVAVLDTNCVMAYWGLAMANVYNEKRARQFVERAVKMTNGIPRREFLYVESLAKFYLRENQNETDRHRAYVRSLEQIVEEFPDDIEAKAFLAFKIWENGGRHKISSHTATDSLAKEVLAVKPMHPIHHARIHLWNGEADRRALQSAALCGQGAPGIAHMWHMPGHTYAGLHRYADSAWQQEASARVDHTYMMRNRVLPDQIHNYAHNNEWLVRNLSYLGRVRDAIDLAKNLIELPRHPRYNSFEPLPKKEEGTNAPVKPPTDTSVTANTKRQNSASFGRARLQDVLVRWDLWDELIGLNSTMYLEPTKVLEEEVKRSTALGVAYFSKGDLKNGDAQIAEVEMLLKKQKEKRHAAVDEAEMEAKRAKKSDDEIAKAMSDAIKSQAGEIKSTESALAELSVYRGLAEYDAQGDESRLDEVEETLDEAKGISKERLSRIWLKLDDKEKAQKLARGAAEGATNQVQVLANYIDILAQTGKEAEAERMFSSLRKIASQADLDMPVLHRVRSTALALNLPHDWREPYAPASDVGNRPPLDALGPFRWHPSPAPNWALRNADGESVSLEDYKGRPVVVIFYLGAGCLHCIAQLNTFAPAAADFEKAGLALVAVSTESVEGLKKTLEKSASSEGFPFPVLADPSLDVFKNYRAFDDFEEMPLHGTFLIDGNGLVRWQDISYEPFTDVDFLLKESRRLLDLPAQPVVAKASSEEPVLSRRSREASRPQE